MKKENLHKKLSICACAMLLTTSALLAQDKEKKETNKLQSVTIIGNTSPKYISVEKPTITRSSVSLEETPKSIQVFNENFMKDYQPQFINDVVTLSSSTSYLGDDHGRQNMFAIRGFSGVPVLRDGFNLTHATANSELYNLERVEVLKGPDSIQFGESSPGGIINLVKKKPQKENHAQAVVEFTSNKSISEKIDIGGSLFNNPDLSYRLIAVHKKDEGIKDYNFDNKKVFIAPSVKYNINENHSFTFVAEYLDETIQSDFGTFVKSNGELAAPLEVVTSHPDEKHLKKQKIIGFDLVSNFDTWNSLFKYRYVDYDRRNPNVHMPFFYKESTNQITKFFADQALDSKEHALQYTINKETNLFGKKHRISAGIDARLSEYTYIGNAHLGPGAAYILDLSNISYEKLSTLADHPVTVKYANEDEKTKRYGAFIQDSINITDKVILSTGLRYDKVDPKNTDSSDVLLPQLGLLYKLNEQTSLYANYSKSFTPQTNIDSSGNILEPETGEGYEIGIKQKLFNNNFNLTTALFKIEKENVAMQDPLNPLVYVSSGKQNSSGLEFDLIGEIVPGWSLIASYGYTKTEDKSTNKGKSLAGVPKHSADVFTTYNLESFGWSNTHVGFGAKYIGSRYANGTNSIKIDSNIIYNASLGYKKNNWQANLSVQNLSDESYINTARSARVSVGTPRTVMATVSYNF